MSHRCENRLLVRTSLFIFTNNLFLHVRTAIPLGLNDPTLTILLSVLAVNSNPNSSRVCTEHLCNLHNRSSAVVQHFPHLLYTRAVPHTAVKGSATNVKGLVEFAVGHRHQFGSLHNSTFLFLIKIFLVLPSPFQMRLGCQLNGLAHIYIPHNRTPCGGESSSKKSYTVNLRPSYCRFCFFSRQSTMAL